GFSSLTFGAWTFLAFVRRDLTHQFLYMAMGIAIVVPLLLYTAGIAGMVMRGSPRLISPLLFAVAALLLLWGGVLTGAVRVIHRLKLIYTTADSSVAHYVLGATVVAAVGAIHYWWPQILRQPLREGAARLTAVLLLLG